MHPCAFNHNCIPFRMHLLAFRLIVAHMIQLHSFTLQVTEFLIHLYSFMCISYVLHSIIASFMMHVRGLLHSHAFCCIMKLVHFGACQERLALYCICLHSCIAALCKRCHYRTFYNIDLGPRREDEVPGGWEHKAEAHHVDADRVHSVELRRIRAHARACASGMRTECKWFECIAMHANARECTQLRRRTQARNSNGCQNAALDRMRPNASVCNSLSMQPTLNVSECISIVLIKNAF